MRETRECSLPEEEMRQSCSLKTSSNGRLTVALRVVETPPSDDGSVTNAMSTRERLGYFLKDLSSVLDPSLLAVLANRTESEVALGVRTRNATRDEVLLGHASKIPETGREFDHGRVFDLRTVEVHGEVLEHGDGDEPKSLQPGS